jgi:predicted ABC-type transport system involved in lysophospholipase L1 biosynthesis ATPase subunit
MFLYVYIDYVVLLLGSSAMRCVEGWQDVALWLVVEEEGLGNCVALVGYTNAGKSTLLVIGFLSCFL